MPDVTLKSIDEMEAIYGGLARRARAELGVTAWGMHVFTLPPDWDGYPNHIMAPTRSTRTRRRSTSRSAVPRHSSRTAASSSYARARWCGSDPTSCAGSFRARKGSASWRSAAHPAHSRPEPGRSSVPIPPARPPGSVPAAMDEQAFALLIEPRRALHLHCYRMLGSPDCAT
jgi:hypothetical protein